MSLQNIELNRIRYSETAAQGLRRHQLDDGKLQELAESIRSAGVLQPILVRRLTSLQTGDVSFECVAGERRMRAAVLAGLAEIPATVRDLTDSQVVELQLIENLQRVDLHELAEAEGYEQLLKLGHDVDAIAVKVGKSKATVYARMKLLALTPAARKSFYQGKIAASVALLLARIPVPKLQDEALKEVAAEYDRIAGDREGAPYRDQMSVRAATAHIHSNYMLRLGDAGFPSGDAMLVPAAGACGPCPKRTGNQPELFGDVKAADVCSDPVCFKQKVAAHAERLMVEAKATGQKVLTGKEAKAAAPNGVDSSYTPGYVKLADRDYDRKGTYRQTLGKDYVPVLLQDAETGKVIEVAPRADVDKIHKAARKETAGDDGYKKRELAATRKHKLAIEYRVALFKAVRAGTPKRKNLVRSELELVAQRLLDRLDFDSKKRLFAACEWEPKKARGVYSNGFNYEALPVRIPDMLDDELVGLIRDVTLAGELQVWQHGGDTRPKELEAAAKREDVNAAAIKRQIDGAAAAKKAKRSPKVKAVAKNQRKARAKK